MQNLMLSYIKVYFFEEEKVTSIFPPQYELQLQYIFLQFLGCNLSFTSTQLVRLNSIRSGTNPCKIHLGALPFTDILPLENCHTVWSPLICSVVLLHGANFQLGDHIVIIL